MSLYVQGPESPGGGRVAYVVFSQPEELQQALHMCDGGEPVRCEVGRVGMGRWCEEYATARPTVDLLERAVERSVGEGLASFPGCLLCVSVQCI